MFLYTSLTMFFNFKVFKNLFGEGKKLNLALAYQ